MRPPVRFTLDEAQSAADVWGMNCGPGAVAAILGRTLDEIRPYLGDFERKRYTNPTLMWSILRNLGVQYRVEHSTLDWPLYGLVRVQWHGPWTAPGVPARVAYRHTHWVAADTRDKPVVFDINCICAGGWVSDNEWSTQVVPFLLKEAVPKASGVYTFTHVVEIEPPMPAEFWTRDAEGGHDAD